MTDKTREYSQDNFSQLRAACAAVFPLFTLSRIWCGLWVYAGHFSHPFREKISGSYEGVSNFWLNAWTAYDSTHFFHIATRGYDPQTAPFFPLYPLLLRLAAPNENAMALLGILISNAALLGALLLLYLLVQHEDASTRDAEDGENRDATSNTATRDIVNSTAVTVSPAALTKSETEPHADTQKRARLTVFLMAFSPLACVFSAVYTDALYAFLLVAAFCCARGVFRLASTRAWFLAGVFAALASLTRNSGPIIFLALLAQWFLSQRASIRATESVSGTATADENQPTAKTDATATAGRRAQESETRIARARTRGAEKAPRIALFFVTFPLLAFLAFQLFLAQHFGSLTGITSHENYGRAPMFPLLPILRDAARVLAGAGLEPVTLLGLFVSVAALWMGFRDLRRRAPDAILVLGVMLMQLTFGRTFAPYTNTSLRLMSSNFPFWTMLSRRLESALTPRARVLAIGFYLLLCALFSFLFGLKTFVSG